MNSNNYSESKIQKTFNTQGLRIKKRIRVSFPKIGSGQKGKWQYFMYNECKKDETGEYKEIRRYKIWVANPIDDLQTGDYVYIQSILSFYESYTTYKDGRKFMSIVVLCEIKKPEPAKRDGNDFVDFNENVFDINNFDVTDDDLKFLS